MAPARKAAPGGVGLELRIEEGPATRIAEVRFDGDLGVDKDELSAAFKLDRGDVLNLSLLDEADPTRANQHGHGSASARHPGQPDSTRSSERLTHRRARGVAG